MAELVSDKMLDSTTILAANANGQRPSKLIPDNCYTVIIINPDLNNDLWVAVAPVGTVLDPLGVGGLVPLIIPAGNKLILGIGVSTMRPQSTPAESDQFVYQSSAGTVQANISYLCTVGL